MKVVVDLIVALFFLLGAIPFAAIGLSNGIKAIKGFKEAKKATGEKPIASLILGIVGVATCAEALMLICSFFFGLLLGAMMLL